MTVKLSVLFLLLASPLAAQLPAGWSARPDKGDASGVKFAAMGPGFHVNAGQAAVLYRDEDKVGSKFHTIVTYAQTKAPTHPEGYGLVFGGTDLAGPGQKYTYFLIRGDGMYSVKTRSGDATASVVPWTASDAIQKADTTGKTTNQIEIDAAGAKVVFKVNGKTVYTMETADRAGIVGLRTNHGLDLHISGFAVHKIG